MEPEGVAVPKPAATVVAARSSPSGLEVLVLQRGPESRFLPGYVVFPGGAVEPEDGSLASRWFGSEGEAARACAIRELAEEAGLVLTAGGLVEAEGDDPLGAVSAASPPVGALREISRWIAPEEVPVRFDATFFAVPARVGLEPRPDGEEVDRAWWARPADVLADFAAEGCRLYWPTFKVLESLSGCASVDDVLALRIPQVERDDEVAPLS
ncbi:MAG: NUDIX hydrolase [Actinomycetota bacterium]